MFMTLAPIALAWILALFILRAEKPRRLAMVTLGMLVVALVLMVMGHAETIKRIEGAKGETFFNEKWLENAREHSMRAVILMLVLGALPAVLALVGLIRTSGPLLGPLEPTWLANGTWRTRRFVYSWLVSGIVCLIAGGTALAAEWLNH